MAWEIEYTTDFGRWFDALAPEVPGRGGREGGRRAAAGWRQDWRRSLVPAHRADCGRTLRLAPDRAQAERRDLRANKWHDLYKKLPAGRRAAVEAEVSALVNELPLRELRRARQLSQEQLAEALSEKQSSISKIEQRTDMYVSTLRRYIEGMGGELIIAVRFPNVVLEIDHFGELVAESAPRHRVVKDAPPSSPMIGVPLGRAAHPPKSPEKMKRAKRRSPRS